jgi:hypothetical protein
MPEGEPPMKEGKKNEESKETAVPESRIPF